MAIFLAQKTFAETQVISTVFSNKLLKTKKLTGIWNMWIMTLKNTIIVQITKQMNLSKIRAVFVLAE